MKLGHSQRFFMATEIEPQTGREFDADGFIMDMHQWNPAVAIVLAKKDGLNELSQAHWSVIYFLREHYLEKQSLPPMRHVCHVMGMSAHCVDDLFLGSREAWRISGLPNPGEEAKAYM
jgi:TusE/DsrC/DsvC family sulfur relay protein